MATLVFILYNWRSIYYSPVYRSPRAIATTTTNTPHEWRPIARFSDTSTTTTNLNPQSRSEEEIHSLQIPNLLSYQGRIESMTDASTQSDMDYVESASTCSNEGLFTVSKISNQ